MPRLDGIDIYHGQADKGPVELWKVAAMPSKPWWFAAKATQSTTYKDPRFAEFQAAAKPLFTHRLGYHWTTSLTDPHAQADEFLTATNGAEGIGAMQDMEEKGITVAGCLAWFERTEEHTRRPGVGYGGLYVEGGSIWNSPELRQSAYGIRPFVVAAYVDETNLDARMLALHSRQRDGWQFSSNGPVDGIVGRCDMDQIDNRPAFDMACGVTLASTSLGDDMHIRLLCPSDSPARFFAECTENGVALRCEWTGPGDDPKVAERIAAHYAAGMSDLPCTVKDLINVSLNGEVPTGMSLDQFANSREIALRQRGDTQDNQARDGVAALNTSMATVGQEVGDIKRHLREAGA